MSNILLGKTTITFFTSIVRKFWWTVINKDKDTNPTCLRACQDICKPMYEGGPVIRDLSLINKSTMAMMAWRIIKNLASLLTKILTDKYLHNYSIW